MYIKTKYLKLLRFLQDEFGDCDFGVGGVAAEVKHNLHCAGGLAAVVVLLGFDGDVEAVNAIDKELIFYARFQVNVAFYNC